jgi:hypothetical protein
MARNALGARDALIFRGRLEHHSGVDLAGEGALHFLPRRLTRGKRKSAARVRRLKSLTEFDFRQQYIHRALSQIDADAVASPQGVADGTGAAHEQDVARIDVERGIIDVAW